MKITSRKLTNKEQTASEMKRLINSYSSDLSSVFIKKNNQFIPITKLSIREFFDFVRTIPYRRDQKPIEVVSRPKRIINVANQGIDCKKKAILISAYLKERGLPFRLIASSRLPNKRIHHVFPQIGISGEWFNLDATYDHYKPFETKIVTKSEVL